MRFFNTSGPVVADDHYCIPPLDRLNFAEVRRLIRDKRYFVLHAPRQTGKTSVLLALRRPAQRRRDLSLRVRQRGRRAGPARRCGTGDAHLCWPGWRRGRV